MRWRPSHEHDLEFECEASKHRNSSKKEGDSQMCRLQKFPSISAGNLISSDGYGRLDSTGCGRINPRSRSVISHDVSLSVSNSDMSSSAWTAPSPFSTAVIAIHSKVSTSFPRNYRHPHRRQIKRQPIPTAMICVLVSDQLQTNLFPMADPRSADGYRHGSLASDDLGPRTFKMGTQ